MIKSPLSVKLSGKKKFILNLNNYRNLHYMASNTAKIQYKKDIDYQISQLFTFKKITLTYILYPATKRKTDISNVLSIHDKFFCDALVEKGVIADDDYNCIPEVNYKFGEVDKESPRVEIHIKRLTND